ncbi:hypothetical protein DM01DRAFT_1331081 [Hesseltinella vesiculosa]|uniref:ER membrane protein complex subunit 1 n=1 Tax=Hesseltinella vesiculosa TaxID=101127 RepID=A0A1X2GY87_9FUNG|nr:hypothetical protein DM01DRAFT_1331081 [Hesseltinella vesiculosa]
MQWRALILFLSGLSVIYLASLLQDAPFPHPAKVQTNDGLWVQPTPNATVLNVHDDTVFQSLVYYGLPEQEKASSGTGEMKYGLYGNVVLLRKPLQGLLVNDTSNEAIAWTTVFEHRLRGCITKISTAPSTQSLIQFALLYHTVNDESPQYFTRIYYLPSLQSASFEYKDFVLPGTTWIKSFSLEHASLLISRDPDMYQYRILALPDKLTAPPHSELAKDMVLSTSEMGNPVPPLRDPLDQLERHDSVLSKLYSPIQDTYRVIALDYYKTRAYYYVSIAVADNASMVTQLTEIRGETPAPMWHLRTFESNKEYYSDDELMEYNGVLDIPQLPDRLKMTCTSFSSSTQGKSVVFPIARDKFMTLDYTDRLDLLQQNEAQRPHLYRNHEGTLIPEFYYLDKYNIQKVYDGDIYGLSVNNQGDLLAVWTELNFVYVYKRGAADVLPPESAYDDANPSARKRDVSLDRSHTSVLAHHMDQLFGTRFSSSHRLAIDTPSDLPGRWQLRQVITPSTINVRHSKNIAAVSFVNVSSSSLDHIGDTFLLMALKNGAVHSYLIDTLEIPAPATLGRFLSGQWDMLMAMCVIIFVFVFNEYQNYGHA